MQDRRVRRRGVRWMPKESQVAQARAMVREGHAVDARWLPFLPPSLRIRAKVRSIA